MNVIVASVMSFLPYVFILLVVGLILDSVFVAFTGGRLKL